MVPRPGGLKEYVLMHVAVMSDDCEFTKVGQYGTEYPLSIAPLRELAAFKDGGFDGHIRGGRVRWAYALPQEDPLDDEYFVDLRLIQPIPAADLLELRVWACLGDELKRPLQAKLSVFFTRDRILKG
jgi:hypothetical protein